MPSMFLSLKKRKSRTKSHTANGSLKRNPHSSNTSSNSSSRYSQASGEPGKTDTIALLSPPPVDLSEKRPDDDVPSALIPISKTILDPESELSSRALGLGLPTKLTRRASRVSFSDMRFGGTSMLGGYGRKSQRHDVDDKERLSYMKSQVSAMGEREGQKDDKEIGSGAAALVPTHGIMKTATNASAGVGMHSVRFTLDLPPKLDLDLSLSDEKVEDGSLDKKNESTAIKEPSRWGRQTTEAVLDRSKIVSTEFVSREDDGVKESDEGGSSMEKRESESIVTSSAFETELYQQQSTERDYSQTSTIATLDCESTFIVRRLEDLARVEPNQSDGKVLPRVPTMGRVSSGPESLAKRQARVFICNGSLVWDGGIEEVARIPASSVNNRMTRRESLRKANQSDGCVSA
ncbi:hypothetical protein AGABI2DRAFT_120942 [Agaricus bisporus var. bisporus H97]|uniref:hypothetical protein n=1 Tax=Agaricus bisporus var. bisporus (strain H97 / ATCC MYA-4626 / FGSC 10389) TaxID=936046 RepID=UPI00029F5D30|nr:hypothetical protein AGABI2DRAFT_120942 [Agaricus bisporus var. bisporus H97]EKV44846.1 hypothetical protein AGABI2DRAFT_120942 [Agaricus bisporus var. bisporus H97]